MTTLQKEIFRFVLIISSAILFFSILIIVLWVAWLRVQHPDFLSVGGLVIAVVSVNVAFIPEGKIHCPIRIGLRSGLPMAVTMSLTIIARAMKKQKVLCKSLSTVETLGCINILCSDKTGTLTENRMSVTSVSISFTETRPKPLIG
jgi:sodium/potassium-transporting ATPase subunit alpha